MARLSFHYLKLNFAIEVQFTTVIRDHHIYKSVWTPTSGEKLTAAARMIARKPNNMMNMQLDVFHQANTGTELVGHVPMSYLIYTFLRAYDDIEVSVKVTGSRGLEN